MPWTNDQLYAMVNKPEPEEIARFDLVNKPDPEELMHYGVLGMKWGVRRYQNKDGSYTEAGKRRAEKDHKKAYEKAMRNPENIDKYYDKLSEDELKKVKKKYSDIMEVKDRRAKVDKTRREAYAAELKIKESERKLGLLGTIAFTTASIGTIVAFVNSPAGRQTARFIKRNAIIMKHRLGSNLPSNPFTNSGKRFVDSMSMTSSPDIQAERMRQAGRTYWRLA